MTTETLPAIECRHIGYSRGNFRLESIGLSIPQGQLTTIVGPNGSGKSTLLRLLSGLAAPGSGEVLLLGKPLQAYARRDLARTLSMLPQSRQVPENLTVRELAAYGRAPYRSPWSYRPSTEDNALIDRALQLTGTAIFSDRMFHTLSGGEQQKARIAMTLAQNTEIVLLDEPTTFLDLAHQLDVMNTLREINRETGITIVMVLHDLPQAAAYSHYMIALKRGTVAAAGNPRELLNTLFLHKVYELDATVHYVDDYPVIIPKPYINWRNETIMIIVNNTSQIAKGQASLLIDRFDKVGKVESMEGFLGLEVLLNEKPADYDEVTISTRWNSKEDFQSWTRSEAFREAHSHRDGTPAYILSNTISFHEVKIVRNPVKA
ncbi:heme oxygenase [Paenibacillus sp. HW567]|uniref:heme oxygenase n=1 Tax=Paenibacillus sp. HW567 TaxID=1034769 RepID=UPI000361E586|nr:heme oxygenase [Paenibacillus sp. HW567]